MPAVTMTVVLDSQGSFVGVRMKYYELLKELKSIYVTSFRVYKICTSNVSEIVCERDEKSIESTFVKRTTDKKL